MGYQGEQGKRKKRGKIPKIPKVSREKHLRGVRKLLWGEERIIVEVFKRREGAFLVRSLVEQYLEIQGNQENQDNKLKLVSP